MPLDIQWETYGCFRKLWYPQIIHFNRVFHCKPSILGYHHFRKPPYGYFKKKPVVTRDSQTPFSTLFSWEVVDASK